jgi:hypothetical protein
MTGAYITSMELKKNNIWIAGSVKNQSITLDTSHFTSSTNFGIIIGRLDLAGNVQIAKSFVGYNPAAGLLYVDEKKHSFLAGGFSDSIRIDGLTLSNNGVDDLLLCKFDSNFNLIWATQSFISGIYAKAYLSGSAVDHHGGIYVTGSIDGTAIFGDTTITSNTDQDMILARYDSLGNCVGVTHFGRAYPGFISVDNAGDLLVAGEFVNSVEIGNTTLQSHGMQDMYFAKSDPITSIELKKKSTTLQLIIYANPTTGICNIKIPEDFRHEKNLVLQIYDNKGTMIQNIPVIMDQEKISFNISAQAKGMYNAILSNGKKSYSGKIVFE